MTTESMSRRCTRMAMWMGIVGSLLIFLVLRWNNFNAPLIRDEGEYAYAAQLLTQGIAPYDHAFIQKPPMIIYSYATAQILLPGVFWSPRLLAGVFVALATVLLGYVAYQEFGRGPALATIWLVTPMIPRPGIEQFAANTEMFMLLPLLATVAIYVHGRKCGHPRISWFAAGFLAVTTLLYKYTALPLLALVFAAWVFEIWRDRTKRPSLWLSLAVAFAGGLLAASLELAFFLVHDGGQHWWECTIVFNHYYTQTGQFGLAAFGENVKMLWAAWWILFLLPFMIFLRPTRRIWFWVGMFVAALLSTGMSQYGHYYIIVMPSLALLCALGLSALATWTSARLKLPVWLTGGGLAMAVMILLILPDLPLVTLSPSKFAQQRLAGYPFIGAVDVARKVAERTSPADSVYVAGSEPEILAYAKRRSVTRFITAYALMLPTPVARQYQIEAIHDLQANPPKIIVFVQAQDSWIAGKNSPPDLLNFLPTFLKDNYSIVGGYVPDGEGGSWLEPLPKDQQANLLVLERKATQ